MKIYKEIDTNNTIEYLYDEFYWCVEEEKVYILKHAYVKMPGHKYITTTNDQGTEVLFLLIHKTYRQALRIAANQAMTKRVIHGA